MLESIRKARGPKESGQAVVQFYFMPETGLGQIEALPKMEQAASDFLFDPSLPPHQNTVAVEAPILFGLDIPHFWKWYELSNNNYLDGYIQHSTTAQKGEDHPCTEEELQLYRDGLDEGLKNPWELEEADLYILGIQGTLRSFDRLAQQGQFDLAVEKLSGLKVLQLLATIKRYAGRQDKQADEDEALLQKEFGNVETLYRIMSRAFHANLKEEGKVSGDRIRAKDRFLKDVITRAQRRQGISRIFVPRDILSYHISFPDFETMQDNSGLTVLSPAFSEEPTIDKETELVVRFVKDPNATLSRDEIILRTTQAMMHAVTENFSMTSYTEKIAAITESKPLTELDQLMREVIGRDNNGIAESILNYLGQEIVGMDVGSVMVGGRLRQAMAPMLDQIRQSVKERLKAYEAEHLIDPDNLPPA